MASSLLALLLMLLVACVAFNLDPLVSVVKRGRPGSLFGFSVALHQDLTTGDYRLLVGAPTERAELGVPANRTGGVYLCPISSDQSDCTRVRLIDPEQLHSEDLIEDMWLGVTVASQGPPGGRVLMCGHRFAKLYGAYSLRHMTGHCYVRGNDLHYNDSDAHWQNPEQVCRMSNQFQKAQEHIGLHQCPQIFSHLGDVSGEVMCSMGMSAAISQTEIIVGSPGSFDWQGNVHVLWMNSELMFHTQRNAFANTEQRNIYIGYSVALAPRLLSQQLDSIITGAPKDSRHDARGSVFLALKSGAGLQILQRLRGEQMGSYYGNALAVMDLNNDGWNDLLVGAPFFFQRQQEVGGAVYMYLNSGGRFDSRPTLVLRGPPDSAFGMALCAAGDLDLDGFQDFVVGAPFHGSGSVMIFNNGPDGVPSQPSQVVHGSSISPLFRTFGFSLASAQDVDHNHHPDLLVGSLDDSAVLLRGRPVVELNQSLHVSPDMVDPSDCDSCIRVTVCFSYTFASGGESDKDNITMQFRLGADVNSLKSRVRFSSSGRNHVWSHLSMPRDHCTTLRAGLLMPLRDQVQPLVFSLNASLVHKLHKKRSGMQDLRRFPVSSRPLAPVRHQIHIQKACGNDNRCHSNLQMTAQFTDDTQRPLDIVADGHQRLLLDSSLNLLMLHVNVTNQPSPWKPSNQTHHSSSPWRPLDNALSPWRVAEDAHSVSLTVSIPLSLVYSGVRAKGASQAVHCSVEGAALLCDLGNPLKANQQVEVWIRLQPSEASLRSRQITSQLQLSTLSEQWDLFPLTVSMLVEVSLQASLTLLSAPGPVYFSGHVTGESAIQKTSEIGSLVTFHFQVHRSGRSLHQPGDLMLVFDWPLELMSGKWLLYLSRVEITGTSIQLCSPSTALNPLRLTVSDKEEEEKEVRRRRREVHQDLEKKETTTPIVRPPSHRKMSHTLACGTGARCVPVECPLSDINNSVTISVKARLWNSTFLEDFVEASSVSVVGRATLQLQTEQPAVNMRPQSIQFSVHVFPDPSLPVAGSAPLGVLLLSVLGGLLLLALICLLLWKCGFFVRRGPRPPTLHQGTVSSRAARLSCTDSDGFLIQHSPQARKESQKKKHWVTTFSQ